MSTSSHFTGGAVTGGWSHELAITDNDPLLAMLFNQWFKQPIIKSVFIEATGGKVSQLAE
jgi:hypothetical protein